MPPSVFEVQTVLITVHIFQCVWSNERLSMCASFYYCFLVSRMETRMCTQVHANQIDRRRLDRKPFLREKLVVVSSFDIFETSLLSCGFYDFRLLHFQLKRSDLCRPTLESTLFLSSIFNCLKIIVNWKNK